MLRLRQLARDVEVLLGPDVLELVLHEDEVPELEVAVAGVPVAVRAVLRAAVEQDLGAGPAGAGHPHVPVVVAPAEPDDAAVGEPGHLLPQRDRLVVLVVDGGVEVLLVEAEAAVALARRDQLPGELDRPLLEVVTEGEVAVHLEERAVPGRLADLLDVEGADALLDARRAGVGRRLLAEEVRLEGHHPGVDEQQVGVVVDERRARHDGVAAAAEVGEPTTPDLSGFHCGAVLGVGRAGAGAAPPDHPSMPLGHRRSSGGPATWDVVPAPSASVRPAPSGAP